MLTSKTAFYLLFSIFSTTGRNGCKRTFAAVALLVGQESPYLAVAQAGLVQIHVRTDVIGIEIEAAASSSLRQSAYPLSLLWYRSAKYFPGTQYICTMCLIDSAVVSTFVF